MTHLKRLFCTHRLELALAAYYGTSAVDGVENEAFSKTMNHHSVKRSSIFHALMRARSADGSCRCDMHRHTHTAANCQGCEICWLNNLSYIWHKYQWAHQVLTNAVNTYFVFIFYFCFATRDCISVSVVCIVIACHCITVIKPATFNSFLQLFLTCNDSPLTWISTLSFPALTSYHKVFGGCHFEYGTSTPGQHLSQRWKEVLMWLYKA